MLASESSQYGLRGMSAHMGFRDREDNSAPEKRTHATHDGRRRVPEKADRSTIAEVSIRRRKRRPPVFEGPPAFELGSGWR